MIARKIKVLEGGLYQISIYSESWSDADSQLMVKFNEPEIELGGDFEDPIFTLPTKKARIKKDSPYTQGFDSADHEDAQARADRWGDAIITRLTAAVATLRGEEDDFSGEFTTTI